MEKELNYQALPSPFVFTDTDIFENGNHRGSFHLLPYSDGTVYFYDFVIDMPGQGIGTRVFPYLLDHLAQHYKKIRLQVSSKNTAAMKLYRNFTILEEADL